MFNYKDELQAFPETFGVYIMKDIFDKIIYIGKANNLKKRVNQYFNGTDKRLKIENLRKNISKIEYIITSSELEALILESNLIKENKPKYNTLLKDDKNYSYIEITTEEDFPRILESKGIKNNNSKYFGPFPDNQALKNIINILNKTYALKVCSKYEKSCFYKEINKCCAPCKNEITKEDYNKKIEEIIKILNGNIDNLIKKYTDEMLKYANNLEFEKANICKKAISDLKYIITNQRVSSLNNEEENIIICEQKENKTIIIVFMTRNGKLIKKEHFFMTETEEETKEDIISSFLKQYYYMNSYVPKSIILEHNINDLNNIKLLFNKFKNENIQININEKHPLISLAKQNANIILNELIQKENTKKENLGLKNLENLLNLKLDRIEAYDISNTSGVLNVASMTVFIKGIKKYRDFRKFKLKTEGANDYECIREVIRRRFTDNKLKEFPNIILIDGGKGQISAVKEILEELKINIPICGMIKDDKHKTKGLIFNEKELNITNDSPEFKLITNIQDETHNFAVNYHQTLRTKEMTKSKLDDIKGIGNAKKKELLTTFESVDKIKSATIEDLIKIKGINKELAERIKKELK